MDKNKNKKKPICLLVAFLIIDLLLSGCAWVKPYCKEQLWCQKDGEFDSIQEAVSVQIAPIAINSWEDYVDDLQPKFTVSSDDAVKLALPKTSISQNALASIFSLGAQVGLPQTTSSNSLTQTLGNNLTNNGSESSSIATGISNGTTLGQNGVANSTSNTSETKNSNTTTVTTNNNQGTTQTTTVTTAPGSAPTSNLPSASLPSAVNLQQLSGNVVLDPLLLYKAATAVYEEVGLLNKYVKDAALRHNYVPYLARVQISVQPVARNEPYDVYVHLGAFLNCGDSLKALTPIIPLLVTDDLEVSQTNSALNIAKQLAATLGGIVGNVALQGQASELSSKYNAILGSDLNSLYSVARSGENSIKVRIGASRSPQESSSPVYAMVPQTHEVSFLVLVDQDFLPIHTVDTKELTFNNSGKNLNKGCSKEALPELHVLSYTKLKKTTNGEELDVDPNLSGELVHKLAERTSSPDNVEEVYSKLLASKNNISKGDTHAFEEFSDRMGINNKYSEVLWLGMQAIANISEWSSMHFDIPMKRGSVNQIKNELSLQPITLTDDCNGNLSTTVLGMGQVTDKQVKAKLKSDLIEIPALSISQPLAGSIQVQFPPIYSYLPQAQAIHEDGCKKEKSSKLDSLKLIIEQNHDERFSRAKSLNDTAEINKLYYHAIPKKDGSPTISLALATDTLTADSNGSGKLRVLIKGSKSYKDIQLSISGATLNSVTNASLQTDGTLLTPSNVGQIACDTVLQGLVSGRSVTIRAVGRDQNGNPVPASQSISVIPVK